METTLMSERNQQVYDFLREHPTGVLATVDPNGNPDAAVIYYQATPRLRIRFLTKKGTKKRDNLSHHNHATLVVFDQASQTTAQIKGIAEELTEEEEINRAFRFALRTALRTSTSGIPPIAKLTAGDFTAFELKPVDIHTTVYSQPISYKL